jgi:hypothetical protein
LTTIGRNVLKERKLEREAESNKVVEPAKADSPERMPAPPSPHIVKPMHAPARNTRVTDMASYKARWQVSSTSVESQTLSNPISLLSEILIGGNLHKKRRMKKYWFHRVPVLVSSAHW